MKRKSQKEGRSVTLYDDLIKWRFNLKKLYFNNTLITEINADRGYICTDEQCDESNERFRDRLDVDWTGSLTIKDTRIKDSGDYYLHMSSTINRISLIRSFSLTVTGECHLIIQGTSP